MIVTMPIIIIPCFLLWFFPYPLRWKFMSNWAKLVNWMLKAICGLSYEVINPENIPNTPVIFFCKHQSAWETIAMQQILPAHVWVLKRELIWVPVFGWALLELESIAINRKAGKKAMEQVIQQGTMRLNKGRSIMIFPEGTRVAPGEVRRFGMGGPVLAEKSGYPVTLVAHNAGEYWRRRDMIKHAGVIKVVIGPTIETKGKTAAEIKEFAEQWMKETMNEITTLESADH
jgi:1-acyl-sn-glycerol-3-phosphate acyltransferase